MERKADLPTIDQSHNPSRPSLQLLPPSDSIRQVQAAFKRQRPSGMLQPNVSRARRVLVSQPNPSKNGAPDAPAAGMHGGMGLQEESEKVRSLGPKKGMAELKVGAADAEVMAPDDSSITPLSATESITTGPDENGRQLGVRKDAGGAAVESGGISTNRGFEGKIDERISSSRPIDGLNKVQQSSVASVNLPCVQEPSQSVNTQLAASTRINDLISYTNCLSLTESGSELCDHAGHAPVTDQGLKQQDFSHVELSEMAAKSGGTCSLGMPSALAVPDQQNMASAGKDVLHSMTQSSFSGASCVTTMSVRSISAPMMNSTTYNRSSHHDGCLRMELDELNLKPHPSTKGEGAPPSGPLRCSQTAMSIQVSSSAPEASSGAQDHSSSKEHGSILKESNRLVGQVLDDAKAVELGEKLPQGKSSLGDVTDVQSKALLTKGLSSNVNTEANQSSRSAKPVSGKGASAPNKKNYDHDLFFKVNGKRYQKLGKIGSGGSSEVHKVISSDCAIYALKSIKLKGRDYSTAYGFCQEILYLNKLKDKKNIIQLVDYEVTDKMLLKEVMSGSMSNKEGRIKEDAYIYMVLEYGEIDLAHMLAQKWKEMEGSGLKIDENWLRFYWQQILEAVNTIHEERIVHSDLKPANFLLVRGSLKLIDFGIAKAIMSDTTNIQRDAQNRAAKYDYLLMHAFVVYQVGTLNYMSPEAFMCNEHDGNGNTIKCGRPSDIWSLGCILYQMVYGRTPFAEYKTFWAKLRAITDRSYQITYEPVPNPLLIDLMKKCLAWDRSERWRIPQLLEHPFLVPPVPPLLPSSRDQCCQLLKQMAETYRNFPEVTRQCSLLHRLLADLEDAGT
ncbi:Serine/threonine kinase mps1 [Asimina triloba]